MSDANDLWCCLQHQVLQIPPPKKKGKEFLSLDKIPKSQEATNDKSVCAALDANRLTNTMAAQSVEQPKWLDSY